MTSYSRRMARASVPFVLGAALALGGCDDTRRDYGSCHTHPCELASQYCNSLFRCVDKLDSGPVDAGSSSPDVMVAIDTAIVWDAPAVELGAVDVAEDAPAIVWVDAGVDMGADAPVQVAVDAYVDSLVPDAPWTCATAADCLDPRLPLCVANRCAACSTGSECKGNTPICSASHTCVSCAAVDAGCPSTAPACEVDSGRCIECVSDSQCSYDPDKPLCLAGACGGCVSGAKNACATRSASKPVCLPNGACVECATSADCQVAGKPICDTATNTCKACTGDDQCAAKSIGPGVCLAAQGGRCATDDETIYVGSTGTGTCSDTSANAGSSAMPFCTAQVAVGAAKSKAKSVVVMTGIFASGFTGVSLTQPLTVVGKSAVITPAGYSDGISITGGEIYLRKLTISGAASLQTGIGINAAPTSGNTVTLHMDSCTVTNNPGGGILLNGAAFEIKNTSVTSNGPSSTGWGGILVQDPPAGGPTTLDHVSISNNRQIGLSCGTSIAASNTVFATGNVGGIDISSTCGVVPCTIAGPTCGAQ
jgi:hypothetical protein